ncbi:MAG TPA: hypothetical protein VEU51_15790, partial [Candidatus Acidoferrales bacterium]|nr:hypothetical protein [Candidatus Acidoferrales bacterium]
MASLMDGNPNSAARRPKHPKWPFDLSVFAAMSGLWALCLMLAVYAHTASVGLVDPLETVFAGVRFAGDDAQTIVIVEAGIFATISIGMFARQRWALLMALIYMAEVVVSHLVFVIAYLPIRLEWMSVRATALQGPMLVMITLYLWIRGHDFLFET